MPEASTGETQAQSGPTAARQMLAALTRQSQEISKKFSDSCEYLARLNSTLENKVNARLADINETAESIVRVQLENLSAEKEAVVAELTNLRQEELKVLQSIGKDLREALNKRLLELVVEFKAEFDEKFASYREGLLQTENEVSLAMANLRKVLNEKMPLLLSGVREEASNADSELEKSRNDLNELMNQEAGANLDTLVMHCDDLKRDLERRGEDYVSTLAELVDKLISEQNDKLKARTETIASLKDEAANLLNTNMDDAENLIASFSESCKQVTDLRLGLHSSMANNIALIYRTEMLSLAQETEDQLVIVRSHLHAALRTYHDYYTEQSASLLAKFEKGAREALPEKTEEERQQEEEVPEELSEIFAKLKVEVNDKIKEIVALADRRMDESLGEFRQRLNKESQELTGKAESAFNDFRKQTADAVEENKARLEDLSEKTNSLEQLVHESKELISAFDQSNLEF